MSKKHIIFPPGEQPTRHDMEILTHEWDAVYVDHDYKYKGNDARWKVGVDKETQRLVFEFDEEAYDHALTRRFKFEELIKKWEAREEKCDSKVWFPDFKEDKSALQPVANDPEEYTLAPPEPPTHSRRTSRPAQDDGARKNEKPEPQKAKKKEYRHRTGEDDTRTAAEILSADMEHKVRVGMHGLAAEKRKERTEFIAKWALRMGIAFPVALITAVGVDVVYNLLKSDLNRERFTRDLAEDGMNAPLTPREKREKDEEKKKFAENEQPGFAEKEKGKKEEGPKKAAQGR